MIKREAEHMGRRISQEATTQEKAPEVSSEKTKAYTSRLITLVPVCFRNDRPSVHCDAGGLTVDEGEWVVVPCELCSEVGQVAGLPIRIEIPARCDIPKIERLATTREIEHYYQNIESEKNARRVCQERIEALGLQMKLVRVESLFDGSKIIFYYSADGRVDFRKLVKDLVRALRTRVEMCQIGIRHEAKMTGGIGSCGRVLCCTSFLKSFDPVSIKMAKVQNLPLNPSKISGFCGRLLCCLTFEYETYREYAKTLPSMGNVCDSPSGEGKVIRRNILKKTVSLATEQNGVVEFSNEELEDFRQRKEQKILDQSQSERHGEPGSHTTGPQAPAGQPQGQDTGKKDSNKKEKARQPKKQAKKIKEAKKEEKGKKGTGKKRNGRLATEDASRKASGGGKAGRGRRRGSRRRGKQGKKAHQRKDRS